MKRIFKTILLIFCIIFVVISITPYFIRLSVPQNEYNVLPFEESRFADIGGTKIHYRLWVPEGDINGRVMMIHGLGGSTFSWIQSVDVLVKKGFMVLLVDLPGFGYSDRSPGIDHSQAGRSRILWQLAETVTDYDNDKSEGDWILVGHSMGGGTAAAMAILKQDKTKALVLVAGALFDNTNTAARLLIRYPPMARWARVLLEKYAINPERISSFLSSAYGRTPSADEIDGYLEPLRLPGTSYTMIDMIKTAKNEPVDDLKQLKLPVLGIWGENDTWVPLSNAYRIKEHIPHMSLYVIDDSAHCPMETHPDEFNKILVEHLGSIR